VENNNNNNSNGNKTDIELDRFKQILNNKISEKKNQIFPSHSMAYNNNVQHEVNCLKWVLGITNQKQMQISQVEDIVQNEVNKLDTTLRTKSLSMQKRDKFIMYSEILNWVLYVIQSIKEKGLHWQFNI